MAEARAAMRTAKTADELRAAQAVVLPLDYGLSLAQTARVIGRSVPWTCRLRNRFLAGEIVQGTHVRGGGAGDHDLGHVSVGRIREVGPRLPLRRDGEAAGHDVPAAGEQGGEQFVLLDGDENHPERAASGAVFSVELRLE